MSKPELIAIETPKAEVHATIVRDLEVLLERAKRGEFESLLWFADSATEDRMTWGTSGAPLNSDEVRIIGRLAVLQHTFLTKFVEGTRVVRP